MRSDEQQPSSNKILEKYLHGQNTRTLFYSSLKADQIEQIIVENLRIKKIEPQVNEKKFKIKFEKICVRLYEFNEKTVVVEFTKTEGG